MLARIAPVAAIAALLLLLVACQDAAQKDPRSPTLAPTSTHSPYTGYLTEEIPPCSPIAGASADPCEPGVKVVTGVLRPSGSGGWIFDQDEPFTIRHYVDGSSVVSIPHVVLRGVYIPDTVRCTSGNPYRMPSFLWPGYLYDALLIQCYADVRVSEYILGKGPARLTVLAAFHHYGGEGYYAEDAANSGMTEKELVEMMRRVHEIVLEQGQSSIGEDVGIYGREVVLFVGPGHNHAHEVWEVFRTWGVEKQGDGTVVVVHPDRDSWKRARPDKYIEHQSKLEVDLSRFKKGVLAAHEARVEEYGGRIASVNEPERAEGVALPMLISDIHSLGEFMVSTGAYDHPDGTPVPPPPVPGEGDPVPDVGVDDSTPAASVTPPGGIEDSTPAPTAAPPAPQTPAASLADGAFTMSWVEIEGAARYKAQVRKSGPDGEWVDVETTTNTSSRFGFEGGPDCGSIYQLRALAYGDGTTYAADWSEPSGVAEVTTEACNRSPEFGAASYSFTLDDEQVDGSLAGTVAAADPDEGDTVTYSITAGNDDGKFAIDASTGEITVAGALDYETTQSYTLTVQANDGNGGSATTTVNITVTEAGGQNTTPYFEGSFNFFFSVPEDAATGSSVGTVAATDDDEGDAVTYSVPYGNEDGKFAINTSTGEITVAGALDYETVSSYELTVEATDRAGDWAAASVTITVTDAAESPSPGS